MVKIVLIKTEKEVGNLRQECANGNAEKGFQLQISQSSHELHAYSYITKEEIITSNDTEESITQHVVLQEEPITVHTETTTSRTPSPQQSPHTLHEYSFITKKQYD
ncbi:hypothetical protein ILUMI_18546, partial [Ignelater luminosus]